LSEGSDDTLKHKKSIESKKSLKHIEAIMKKLTVLLTALFFVGGANQGLCASGLINLNFDLGEYPYKYGAAINGDEQTWNPIDDPGMVFNHLKYSDGVTSNVSVSMNLIGEEQGLSSITGDNQDFMNSYFITSLDANTIDISGLSAGVYNVYVYSQRTMSLASELQMTASTDGGHLYSFSLSNDGSPTSLMPDVNWQVQSVLVGSSGTINMLLSDTSAINGIQIQAVPEPGSVVLLGIGGVVALSQIRRKTENDSTVID
jgi:hypothetical protein